MTRPLLDDASLAAALVTLPGWTARDGALHATFAVPTYEAGVALAVQIALYAQRVDHHPDLLVQWRKVTVSWGTHDAGGITARDVVGARYVASIVAQR